MIRQEIVTSLRVTAVTLVLTGILYPLLTTGVACDRDSHARYRDC